MEPITAGIMQFQQAGAEENAAQYNEQLFKQQGVQAQQAASANEAESLRKSGAALGEQAAGLGEANIGSGRTVQGVERQSAINARMDALNIWYGGELEASNAENQANYAAYQAKIASQNKTNALIGAGLGAGTQALLIGAGGYYGGAQGALSVAGGGGLPFF